MWVAFVGGRDLVSGLALGSVYGFWQVTSGYCWWLVLAWYMWSCPFRRLRGRVAATLAAAVYIVLGAWFECTMLRYGVVAARCLGIVGPKGLEVAFRT